LFKEKVEELIVNTNESIGEANRKIEEITLAQKEINEYADVQKGVINKMFEQLIDVLKKEQIKVINDFNEAVNVEKSKLAIEESKYTKIKEELQDKNVYFGNLLVDLADSSKLINEKEQNIDLENKRTEIQQLHHKAHKGGIPIIDSPYLSVNLETFKNAIDSAVTLHASNESEAISKKICYFGDKSFVLKFDIKNEVWEHSKIPGPYEFAYYAAAVSTHKGDILIAGGGSHSEAYLYTESRGRFLF